MTPAKRAFDIGFALLLILLLAPVILVVALLIALIDGRPVLYLSERMRTPDTPFCLWKFRTMRVVENDAGVSSGYKQHRVTALGRRLRAYRLDELPQLLNVLRGDMSFVGPRPPLRCYVEACPDLYAKVLEKRPGVTGLATLVYHRTEEKLLSACTSHETGETTYVTRCIPRKARLDLIWSRHQSLCYDLRLICQTVIRVFYRRRARRLERG
ncbi:MULTISPECIES: sugar transferase [unclassified Roseovarius]|jgi:lipopolysaccharide/colanic/teichoic acid biosynthesis glycosyltransferase|uniref:sugar transferase n=1 Tax=unclassified Roseovarius TaxID=2614913 RepID=UPI00006874AB|nr:MULTISPECIES: sugar transferase [unclassified Roseovarius]EAQ25064.1 sugar transferase [Roseovarius sp. 217]KJS43684.1 MAG: sugar transferase [Roseovarius sp. BRH_c41]